VTGKIVLTSNEKQGQVAFLASSFVAPKAMKTELKLGAISSLRVWLNGKLVYKGKPSGSHVTPDMVSIQVNLKAGQNQLLFEVTSFGEPAVLFARFQDRDRELVYLENGKK
jgi:hypothetical protein